MYVRVCVGVGQPGEQDNEQPGEQDSSGGSGGDVDGYATTVERYPVATAYDGGKLPPVGFSPRLYFFLSLVDDQYSICPRRKMHD